jgi:transcriptional regulator with XRE-family HTH domain
MSDERTIMKQFGDRIRSLRILHGLSQAQLSHMTEMDPGYISKVELGKTNPGLVNIYAFAKAFKIEAWELLKYNK